MDAKVLDSHTKGGLLDRYRAASRRLLLLDYDGTLTPFFNIPTLAEPDNILLELLESISGNERNSVYIISERDNVLLESWFAQLPLRIITESDGKIMISREDREYPPGYNTRRAVRDMLDRTAYDFILAIGDNHRDEELFDEIRERPGAFTIKVGAGSSGALYRVNSPRAVISLLRNMSGC